MTDKQTTQIVNDVYHADADVQDADPKVPLCMCADPCYMVERVSGKEKSKGRAFYACVNGSTKGCNAFMWKDEVKIVNGVAEPAKPYVSKFPAKRPRTPGPTQSTGGVSFFAIQSSVNELKNIVGGTSNDMLRAISELRNENEKIQKELAEIKEEVKRNGVPANGFSRAPASKKG